MTPDRDQRRANIHRARELSRMLDEWDPIGVYEGEGGEELDDDAKAAPGEYSDLVWPIVRMLDSGSDARALARGIQDVMNRDYGTGAYSLLFAERLVEWRDAT
jgi:hypothetical protein